MIDWEKCDEFNRKQDNGKTPEREAEDNTRMLAMVLLYLAFLAIFLILWAIWRLI